MKHNITETDTMRLMEAFINAENEEDDEQRAKQLLRAWNQLWDIMTQCNDYSDSYDEFEYDYIASCAEETTMALWNAKMYEESIKVQEQILKIAFFENDNRLMHENAKRELADLYQMSGNAEKSLVLYEQYLAHDPLWGWGWIGYFRMLRTIGDPRYQETIAKVYDMAVNDPDLRDRRDVLEELAEEYKEAGEMERSKECIAAAKKVRRF